MIYLPLNYEIFMDLLNREYNSLNFSVDSIASCLNLLFNPVLTPVDTRSIVRFRSNCASRALEVTARPFGRRQDIWVLEPRMRIIYKLQLIETLQVGNVRPSSHVAVNPMEACRKYTNIPIYWSRWLGRISYYFVNNSKPLPCLVDQVMATLYLS